MPKRKPGKPTLSPGEVERILAALKKALKELHRENQSSLARALGVEPSAISQLVSKKNQPSYETAKALGAHLGVDFRQWLDPAPGVEREQRPEPSKADPLMLSDHPANARPFYTREHFVELLDPALETLIREGNSAADSRAALDGVVAIHTAKGSKPTLDDVLRLARLIIKDQTRASGSVRRGKHS
jgi:transcriptional regulator with XRE-family HTH domain